MTSSSSESSLPQSSPSAPSTPLSVPLDIQWVFFDLDGTLWDHEEASHQALVRIAERYKLAPDDFLPVFQKSNQRAWDMLAAGEIERQEMRRKRFRDALIELQFTPLPTNDQLDEMNHRYLDEYLMEAGHYPIEGGVETLFLVKNGPWRLALLTNGSRDTQRPKLRDMGIEEAFDLYWGPEDAQCLKPDPMFFITALRRAGCSPHQALMIGDSLVDDILPALELGMKAWWFNRKKLHPYPQMAGLVSFSNWSDLATAFGGSNQLSDGQG